MRSILIIFFILAILAFPLLFLKEEKHPYNLPIQVIQAKKNSPVLYQSAGSLPYSASFGNKKEPEQAPTKLEVSNSSITTIPETEIKEMKKEGENKVTIIALDGTKFIQTLQKTGIKEEIVIQEPVLEIAFKMSLEGLTPRKVNNLWRFFDQGGKELFYIPKPFMVDEKGVRSENVEIVIKDGIIKIIPDFNWLGDPNRVYPVIIDPSFILNILNVHSHPQAGDNWIVSFETIGTADLTITPDDQATIDDMDFISLKCSDSTVQPQILGNDVIFYPDWSCDTTGEITHLVNVAAPHTLKFQFGDQIKYAYNNPDSVTDTYTDETKIASSENIYFDTSAGQVKLELSCLANGEACTSDDDCCNSICGTDADSDDYFSEALGHTGTCQATSHPYTDCCDSDAGSHPGAGYHTSQNACSSWDWDCSGSIEKSPSSCLNCASCTQSGSCDMGCGGFDLGGCGGFSTLTACGSLCYNCKVRYYVDDYQYHCDWIGTMQGYSGSGTDWCYDDDHQGGISIERMHIGTIQCK